MGSNLIGPVKMCLVGEMIISLSFIKINLCTGINNNSDWWCGENIPFLGQMIRRDKHVVVGGRPLFVVYFVSFPTARLAAGCNSQCNAKGSMVKMKLYLFTYSKRKFGYGRSA
jgi:hypothetical protein